MRITIQVIVCLLLSACNKNTGPIEANEIVGWYEKQIPVLFENANINGKITIYPDIYYYLKGNKVEDYQKAVNKYYNENKVRICYLIVDINYKKSVNESIKSPIFSLNGIAPISKNAEIITNEGLPGRLLLSYKLQDVKQNKVLSLISGGNETEVQAINLQKLTKNIREIQL